MIIMFSDYDCSNGQVERDFEFKRMEIYHLITLLENEQNQKEDVSKFYEETKRKLEQLAMIDLNKE